MVYTETSQDMTIVKLMLWICVQAMVERANLSSSPELGLAAAVLGDRDVAQFGRQVTLALQRNSTSWLHHNLASIYWRIRGDAPNAVECARKAVHFAPRWNDWWVLIHLLPHYPTCLLTHSLSQPSTLPPSLWLEKALRTFTPFLMLLIFLCYLPFPHLYVHLSQIICFIFHPSQTWPSLCSSTFHLKYCLLGHNVM
jgi:hypothetical protein